jgi:predicted phage terminase large subunit-like protein
LEPNASIILIQTRWHEDDLAGRLLKEMDDGGEQWDVIKLPALAEPDDRLGRAEGQALCPARFPEEALQAKKRKLGSYSFSALYQQRPSPSEGGLFKKEWFSRTVDRPPEGLRWYRGYDLAISTKTSADYTASFRCAFDRKSGNLYIADGFRKRIEFPEQRRYIVDRITNEKNTEHGIEEALHGKALVQDLWREERIRTSVFRGVKVTGDKFSRALSWANRAEAGKVVLVNGPWVRDFIDEVCQFPYGTHDDQVDAVSIAVKMMDSRRRVAIGF